MVVASDRKRIETLRIVLRQSTEALHQRLDARMRDFALGEEAAYAHFLSVQYAARAAIEDAPLLAGLADNVPQVAHLIARDLDELGHHLPPKARFSPATGAQPLGAAWALGGSAMGNRLVLAERRRAGHSTAERFLSDKAGALFFRSLLPALEMPASDEVAHGAVLGAEAVFATFLSAADSLALRKAA